MFEWHGSHLSFTFLGHWSAISFCFKYPFLSLFLDHYVYDFGFLDGIRQSSWDKIGFCYSLPVAIHRRINDELKYDFGKWVIYMTIHHCRDAFQSVCFMWRGGPSSGRQCKLKSFMRYHPRRSTKPAFEPAWFYSPGIREKTRAWCQKSIDPPLRLIWRPGKDGFVAWCFQNFFGAAWKYYEHLRHIAVACWL